MTSPLATTVDQLAALCKKHHVARLWAFGSAVTDDFDSERSDVDLLVEFKPVADRDYADNWFGFIEALEALFERHVDLLTLGQIRNPYVGKSVEASKVLVYEA